MMSLMGLLSLLGCSAERPGTLGVNQEALGGCPDSPNCVSSFDTRESHSIAPINSSLNAIRTVLRSMDRVNIVAESDNYLHAEFTSRMMRYVDDVEFLEDPQGVVHVRSASRIGHSDMGVNRKRVEALRSATAQ